MKFFTAFILLTFFFGGIYFIPSQNAFNAKTCCGRAFCTCSHSKTDPCPFKKMHKPVETEKASGLTEAPCHRNTPKTMLPNYSKEFRLPFSAGIQKISLSERFISDYKLPLKTLFDQRIEHPPSLFSSLL